MSRRLPPRVQAIVDKTPPVCREMYRHVAEMMSIVDDWDGYAAIMREPIDEYRREVDAALAELVALDVEAMP